MSVRLMPIVLLLILVLGPLTSGAAEGYVSRDWRTAVILELDGANGGRAAYEDPISGGVRFHALTYAGMAMFQIDGRPIAVLLYDVQGGTPLRLAVTQVPLTMNGDHLLSYFPASAAGGWRAWVWLKRKGP